MADKDGSQEAYRDLILDGRKRVGGPPAVEDVERLFRGDLTEPEAERVRELLAYYPEMARIMTDPFPATAEGVLTDEELATDLAKIRARVRPPAPVVEISPGRVSRRLALVASLAVVVGLAGFAIWQLRSEPRAVMAVVLYPSGARGGPIAVPVQLSTEKDYTLRPAFTSSRQYREYRVELLDVTQTPPRRVWIREDVPQEPDGTYPVTLKTNELDPGLYMLVLYGINGDMDRLAEYPLRVSSPSIRS